MKKWFSFICACVLCVSAQSQKMYSTQSGQVKINVGPASQSLLGINEQVESRWLESNGQIVLTARIRDFKFDNRALGDLLCDTYLEGNKFSKLDFKGFINDIQHIDLTSAGGNALEADGNLTLHGVTKKMVIRGSLTVLSSGKIMLQSDFGIKLKDFNVSGSDIGNRIAPEAMLHVYCVYE